LRGGARPVGWLGRIAGFLGCLDRAQRGRGEQANRANSQVSAHSTGVKRKLFLLFKSFYNLQTNLNSIQIRILTTSTHKIKYKNTSPFKDKYASALFATNKYLFNYLNL
jgi:hypothetical protein